MKISPKPNKKKRFIQSVFLDPDHGILYYSKGSFCLGQWGKISDVAGHFLKVSKKNTYTAFLVEEAV